MVTRPAWMDEAQCLYMDTEIFFPDPLDGMAAYSAAWGQGSGANTSASIT